MQFGQLKRREFITLLGGAVALPLAARAQQPKMRRIGVLILGNADAQSFGAELRAGLRESGYFEGQNIEFVFRSADNDASSLPALAAELAALKVDVLVALYTPCALAAQKATREIPIVTVSGDPVGLGLVTSLAQPGGNITGISLMRGSYTANASSCFVTCSRQCTAWHLLATPRIHFRSQS
jgi:putative ABC transport system substrate-binding protein